MKVVLLVVLVMLFVIGTPAYAIERGTGSYIDYLILKMQSAAADTSSASVETISVTGRTGGSTYRFQPASPNAIANWLSSVRTFSVTTSHPSTSFGGGSRIDVNTYHLIGDTNEGVQNARGIAQ